MQMAAAVHSHFFPSTTFRGVSFSRPTIHEWIPPDDRTAQPEPTTVALSFLAYDVLRGLFQCSVSVIIPPPPDLSKPHVMLPPLDVQVHLVAAHNMAVPVAAGADGGPISRSGFSHGARGFVSACALGPAGRRGVWVERRRGDVRRVVYGFNAHWHNSDDEDEDVEFGRETGLTEADLARRKQERANSGKRKNGGFQPGTPISAANSEQDVDSMLAHAPRAIGGREVYEVNSCDLRGEFSTALCSSYIETHLCCVQTTSHMSRSPRRLE